MASFVGQKAIKDGLTSFASGTLKVMLLDTAPGVTAYTADDLADFNPAVNQVTPSGTYVAGGQALASVVVSTIESPINMVYLDAANVTWTGCTMSAVGAVVYDDADANDRVLCYIEFDETKTCTDGDFTIQWAAPSAGAIASVQLG